MVEHTKNFSETVTISDSIVKGVGLAKADSFPIRETTDGLPLLPGWPRRIAITIDHTKVTSLLTDFPVMVYLSASSGQDNDDVSCVFDELQADANRKKIRITTADGTECYVEIDFWDDANEKAWLHVKVPSISSSEDTILYLYYDILHADNDTYVGDTNSAAAEHVWDANFKAVYHMSDGASNAHIYDSTDNNNDGTKKGANEPNQVAGDIGKAQDFVGGDDYVNLGQDATLKPRTSDWTVEMLLKCGSQDAQVISCRPNGARWYLRYQTDKIVLYATDGSNLAWYVTGNTVGGDIGDNNPHYVAAVADRDVAGYIYVDAIDETSASITMNAVDINLAADVYLGKYSTAYYTGLQDEVRISSITRSAGWIATTYSTLWDDLLTFGSEAFLGVAKSIGKPLSEVAMGITDAISKEPGLVKADSVAITDLGIVKDVGLNKSDNVAITDALVKAIGIPQSETMTISDALVKAVGLFKTESFTLTDAGIVKDIGLNKAETLTIADTIAKSLGKPLSETLAIADIIAKTIGIIETETFALADSLVKNIGLGKAETLNITDALVKDISINLTEAIAILDSMVMTGTYDRPGIKVAAFLFKRAITAILYQRDINAKSRREF